MERAGKNMKTKITVLTLSAILLALCGPVNAQQTKKVLLIAFLAGGSRSGDALLLEAFWQRMKTLGYVEGKNISAEYRYAEERLNGSQTLRRN